MISSKKNAKKRLDLEFSFYLVGFLFLFFTIAILGTSISANQEYKKSTQNLKQHSEKLLSEFNDRLPSHLLASDLENIKTNAIEFHNKLQQVIDPQAKHNNNILTFVAALFAIFVLIIFLFTSGWVQVRLFSPISELIDLSFQKDALAKLDAFKPNSIDIEILRNLFANLVLYRVEKEKQEKQLAGLEKQTAVASVAAQVAHDIRSPLAALAVLENDLGVLPENKRILVRGAVNRIRDIANNLLDKKRSVQSNNQNLETQPSTQLIFALLEQLITEKRTQYRSKINIEINDQFDSESYGLCALVQAVELKRIISNLVDNAVEALPHGGHVDLKLKLASDENIQIIISDNGIGIESDVLPRLMQLGESHGKPGGSGMGLYYARKTIESWGGTICIDSKISHGTLVKVSLPKVMAPNWFVNIITIRPKIKIVVVDDDISIHQIWRERFSFFCSSNDVSMLHFSTPSEFKNFIISHSESENILFLVDYEFLNYSETGLDLIENANLSNNSILVTSRFDESIIRQRCDRLGIKLIPKGIAGFVPIEVEKNEIYDAILLDDDPLILAMWQNAATENNKRLLIFDNIDKLKANLNHIDYETPIYIDSNLSTEIRGEELLKILHELGYHNLYLATGYDPSTFGVLAGVKAIIGKNPPW